MCLVTYQRKSIKLDKDLIVYKKTYLQSTIDDSVRSLVQQFKYQVNKIYHCELGIYHSRYLGSAEFADYTSQRYYQKRFWLYLWNKLRYINPRPLTEISLGFHAYTTIKRAKSDSALTISEFMIPAGSEVFYDKTGMIVSNNIMFTGKIIK